VMKFNAHGTPSGSSGGDVIRAHLAFC
jgi:hypothetical protein